MVDLAQKQADLFFFLFQENKERKYFYDHAAGGSGEK